MTTNSHVTFSSSKFNFITTFNRLISINATNDSIVTIILIVLHQF
jgi:hypothetical protein